MLNKNNWLCGDDDEAVEYELDKQAQEEEDDYNWQQEAQAEQARNGG